MMVLLGLLEYEKRQELIDSKCKAPFGSLEKTLFIMVQETLDLDFSKGKFELM